MEQETVGALRLFLDYGAVGLAGLMLVLVIFALTRSELPPARERLLRLFMYIGAGCFAVAMLAEFFAIDGEHDLNLTINPNDLNGRFPPPIVMLNGARVDEARSFALAGDATVLVDVSEALGLFDQVASRAEAQERALVETDRLATELSQRIETLRDAEPSFTASQAPAPELDLQEINQIQKDIIRTIENVR